MNSQSFDYGLDVVDVTEDSEVNSNVVSLELNGLEAYKDSVSSSENADNPRILYDNVVIEDISSDENDGPK